MEDVARLAGVSLITVSRVLREPQRVAELTRAKIREAIAVTGYVPNLVAGSLKSRRTGMISCVVPSVEHSFVANVVRGASEVLRPLGFHMILATSSFSPEEEEELVLAFLSRRPDAMMLTGLSHTDGTRRLLAAAGIPVVEVGNISAAPIDMVVGFSNIEASRQIAAAMIAKGRRRIGYLLHAGASQNDRVRDRHEGYRRALGESGGQVAEAPAVEVEFSYSGGAEGLSRLLELDPAIDGVCCSNDVIALGALYECQRKGVAVPRDLGIAGFDDHDASGQCVPPLSTVHVPRAAMGRQAGLLIQRALAGETIAESRVDIGFELRIRETL